MKSPPVQYRDSVAHAMVEAFADGLEITLHEPVEVKAS